MDRLADRLLTNCGVSRAMSGPLFQGEVSIPPMVSCKALWDTGATTSAISSRLVSKLGLVPSSKAFIHSPAGPLTVNVFSVDVLLSAGGEVISSLPVVSVNLDESVDFLIGMDIITLGDFAITNMDQKTTFSFRIPSTETIDFMNS